MAKMASGVLKDGPPNDKWVTYATIDGLDGDAILALLNAQADAGNTTALFAPTSTGNALFFGNYKQ
jgi:hypothetical protein